MKYLIFLLLSITFSSICLYSYIHDAKDKQHKIHLLKYVYLILLIIFIVIIIISVFYIEFVFLDSVKFLFAFQILFSHLFSVFFVKHINANKSKSNNFLINTFGILTIVFDSLIIWEYTKSQPQPQSVHTTPIPQPYTPSRSYIQPTIKIKYQDGFATIKRSTPINVAKQDLYDTFGVAQSKQLLIDANTNQDVTNAPSFRNVGDNIILKRKSQS